MKAAKNAVRTIFACDVSYRPPHVLIGVEGSGFLWNMVRIIVGTLACRSGWAGSMPTTSPQCSPPVASARQAGRRTAPHGLYLQWIQNQTADGKSLRRRKPAPKDIAQEITRGEMLGATGLKFTEAVDDQMGLPQDPVGPRLLNSRQTSK